MHKDTVVEEAKEKKLCLPRSGNTLVRGEIIMNHQDQQGYSIIEGAIRQTLDIPINGCKEEIEADHALALAWMWDTQDVTCPPHNHTETIPPAHGGKEK